MKVSITQRGKIFEGKAPEIINSALTSAMYEATLLLEREVKKKTPIGVFGAQGGLLAAVHGEVQEKGTPVVKGVIAHTSEYGDVIEKGRTKGKKWPKEGTLLRWMEVKLHMDSAEARRKEFVIRRKIGQKGFPGTQMFEKSLKENWPKLKNIFDRLGFNIARKLDE